MPSFKTILDKIRGPTQEETKAPLRGSCRLVLAFVAFGVFFHVYSLRANISVAIVCMTPQPLTNEGNITNYHNDTSSNNTYSYCGNNEDSSICLANSTANGKAPEFAWNRKLQGYILSAFFYGYILTQFAGGWLASRIGAKHVMGFGLLLAGISTIFVPQLARIHYGLLIVQRVFVGMTTAVTFPAANALWGKWAPPLERTKLASLGYAGSGFGMLATTVLSGILCDSRFMGGWPAIFYLTGASSCLTWVLWVIFAFSSPGRHPRITPEERQYIESSLGQKTESISNIPWRPMLTSSAVWSVFICHFSVAWGLYTMVVGLPTYMSDILKVTMTQVGALTALPAILVTLFTFGVAVLVDYLRKRGTWSTAAARKWMQAIGTFVPAACFIGASFFDHRHKTIIMALLGLTGVFGSVRSLSYNVNHLDIAPRYAGVLYGISNTFATVAGMVAPIVMGQLTQNGTREEWQKVFIIASAIGCFGTIIFLVFGKGEEQEWAKRDSHGQELDQEELASMLDSSESQDEII